MTAVRRDRLPGRSGAVPVVVALGVGLIAVAMLGFAPTMNPADLITGRIFDVEVPKVRKLTQTRALVALEAARLRGTVRFAYSASVGRGLVVEQRPDAGEVVRRDTAVIITVSRGPVRVRLPDFVGQAEGRVRDQLRDWEIEPSVERVNSEDVAAGRVLAQSIPPGTEVLGGSPLALVVSLGPVTRPIPDVAGLGIEGAAFRLGQAGFTLGEVTFADNPLVPSGGVVSTEPPANSIEPKDAEVTLTISSGPPAVPIPAVTGRSQSDAALALTRAGFVVGEISQMGPIADPDDGRVLGQNPPAGTIRRPGEVVTLTVRRAAQPPPTTLPPPITAPTTTTTTVAPPAPGGP